MDYFCWGSMIPILKSQGHKHIARVDKKQGKDVGLLFTSYIASLGRQLKRNTLGIVPWNSYVFQIIKFPCREMRI